MGLRELLRAGREYPAVHTELESARAELQQAQQTLRKTQQALRQSTQDRGSLRLALEEQKDYTNFLDHKAKSLQEALVEFCPKLSTPEEMKRFYDTISPGLDDQGFTLYHMARDLTGIDVPSLFAYEDNRGLFETMDGHQLMDWLTAVYFQAVDWEPIPGSTYESAALREVDTSTPEYLAFEKRLYGKVLERMGFDAVLAPEPEVSRTTELKLYSPLRAELVEDTPARDWIDESEPPNSQILDGEDLTAPVFHTAILKGIEAEQTPEEAKRGLMLYYHGPESVNEKVVSLFPTVEEMGGKLYGVAVCQVREQLTPDELAELKGFCIGQYADGWGEGYEQRPRKTEYGDLYVSFWQDKDFFIRSKEEMAAERVPSRSQHRPKRGGEAR